MKPNFLGYPYSYGDDLTAEEAKKNRKKFLTIFLLVWIFQIKRVNSEPIAGVDGFQPAYCPRKNNFYARQATGLSVSESNVPRNPNPYDRPNNTEFSQYLPEFNCRISLKQMQRKFKHANVFGVEGPYNAQNAQLMRNNIIEHMRKDATMRIEGTFKGDAVIHYFNPETNVNVFFDMDTGNFISGWLLNTDQRENLLAHGGL